MISAETGKGMHRFLLTKCCLVLLMFVFLARYCYGQSVTKQEELVITTYYPVPYGDYQELRVRRMAIGPEYSKSSSYCWGGGSCSTSIPDTANLVVEGRVGIGTVSPQTALDVNGKITMQQGTSANDPDSVVVTKGYLKEMTTLTQWSGYFCGGADKIPNSEGKTFCALTAVDQDYGIITAGPYGYKCQVYKNGDGWYYAAPLSCANVACGYSCFKLP